MFLTPGSRAKKTSFTTKKGQIQGTTTNDNAVAGNIGEFISSNVPVASAVAITTSTAANITSISLTAGDWDVSANFNTNNPGTAAIAFIEAWISTASATRATSPNSGAYFFEQQAMASGTDAANSVGPIRISIASTTTVYFGCFVSFTSTLKMYGFIGARRVR